MNQRENSPEAGSLVNRTAVEAVAPSIVIVKRLNLV